MSEATKALVERLFAAHRAALQAFFQRRIRQRAEATDLAQEVYVRMLRVKDPDAIRDIDAYLFTVASNLAREHAARAGRTGEAVELTASMAPEEPAETVPLDSQIDIARQSAQLRKILRRLPPRWHAAIVLQYVHGLSQREIADRLGVSVSMVKKYLGRALGRCRREMAEPG